MQENADWQSKPARFDEVWLDTLTVLPQQQHNMLLANEAITCLSNINKIHH